MPELPMPSDIRPATASPVPGEAPLERPGGGTLVRLFVIPLAIVAAAVGVMFLIGLLAGSTPSLDDAIRGLQSQGGQRTFGALLGPGSKQRYLYAKAIIDQMKQGLDEPQRVKLADSLVVTLDRFTREEEGDIRHLILLALGRVWQPWPGEQSGTAAGAASRAAVADVILRYSQDPHPRTRTAAMLSTAYWAGREESGRFVPRLVEVLSDPKQDLDVRIAAATALGPVGRANPPAATAALRQAMRSTQDPRESEIVWASALSLAQLQDPAADSILLTLLDRTSLSQLQVYDRETDPANPSMRPLNEQEKLRFMINAMEGGKRLSSDPVRSRIRDLAENDPSDRVRYAAREVVAGWSAASTQPALE